MTNKEYNAASISVLEGLEAVRERPGMYIGDTGYYGLHHLVNEVIANSIDEALAGFCSSIFIIIHSDGSIEIKDDGRGIPVDVHSQESEKQGREVSALELVMCTLHAGGKFDNNTYKVSGGLHGVGISCVNALSSSFIARICRNGKIYEMKFSRGDVASPLKEIGESKEVGTSIRFYPDDQIFSSCVFDYSFLCKKVKDMAFLNKNIYIRIEDQRDDDVKIAEFKYENGIETFIKEIVTDPIFTPAIYISKEKELEAGTGMFEVALSWNTKELSKIMSYANNISTPQGGAHVSGMTTALTRVVNASIKTYVKASDSKVSVTGEDIREGLHAIISVKIPNPQFEGQTKQKLSNQEVQTAMQQIISDELTYIFGKYPSICKALASKVLLSAKAREAAKRAKETVRKSVLSRTLLPGKLADCTAAPEESEIYLVEGDSAGGPAKMGRDRRFQAVLPFRGKILNSERSTLDRLLKNNEIKNIIAALGCGVGVHFNIDKLRYHKVIIMTDADVDGLHIRSLILTFFYKHLPELVEKGHIYIARPPLFRIIKKKQVQYVLNEEKLDDILIENAMQDVEILNRCKIALSKEDAKSVCNIARQARELVKNIRNSGMPFEEFVSHVKKDQRIPRYCMFGEDVRDVIFSRDAVENIIRGKVDSDEEYQEKISEFNEMEEGNSKAFSLKEVRISKICDIGMFKNFVARLKEHNLDIMDCSKEQESIIFYVKNGKNNDAEKCNNLIGLIDVLKEEGASTVQLSRYKGLGEMNHGELWETSMNPEKRIMIKVVVNSTKQAKYTFTLLMGEEVLPRRLFIEQNALSAENLDI